MILFLKLVDCSLITDFTTWKLSVFVHIRTECGDLLCIQSEYGYADMCTWPKSQTACFDGSSRPEVFCKKGVLRNFTKFTGKHLCQSLFFNKVADLRSLSNQWTGFYMIGTSIMKELNAKYFYFRLFMGIIIGNIHIFQKLVFTLQCSFSFHKSY